MQGKFVAFMTPNGASVRLRTDAGLVFDSVPGTADGRPAQIIDITTDVPDGHGAWLEFTEEGFQLPPLHGVLWMSRLNPVTGSVSFDADTFEMTKAGTAPFVRSGLVRPNGRAWMDDQGEFYPLGETLFWALRGFKFDRDRLGQNLAWLQGWRWDYERILCAVGWSGNDIDPNWPDYQDLLAGYIDWAYDTYGQRTQLTVWGGYAGRDPLTTTAKVCEVIKGREHKILHAEAVNEWFNNLPDIDTVRRMSKLLMATGVMTASSCASPPSDVEATRMTADGCANVVTVHLDRGQDDVDWRFVRQPWDIKTYAWPTSNNEGKGPASSVSGNNNATQLAQYRVVTLVCRGGAFVLHNGAGIYGVDHVHPGTGQRRTANLWEMPNIDAIMEAVRGLDEILPPGMPHGVCANDGWAAPRHPLSAQAFWPSPAMVGVNKNYAVRNLPDGRWVCAPSGVRAASDGAVGGTFKADANCHVKAYDTLTRDLVKEADLGATETFTLPGRVDTMQAYVVVGEFRL